MQSQSSLEQKKFYGKTVNLLNKEIICLFIYASSCAAVNPYKNIFGIKVVGLAEEYYGLVMFASGLMVTILSIFFGVRSDRYGSFSKIIIFCCCCGVLGNLSVFVWPSATVYFVANCLLLPTFYCVNSLIYGLSAAKNSGNSEESRLQLNAFLRSSYSLAYVLTLGLIGVLALEKDELGYLWLYSAILASSILFIFVFTKSSQKEINLSSPTYSIRKFFNGRNSIRILSVSMVTSLLFTLDAAAPLIIVDQMKSGYSSIGVFEASIALIEVFFIFFWLKLSYRCRISNLIVTGSLIFVFGLFFLSFAQGMTDLYMVIPVLAIGASCLISLPISYFQALAPDKPGLGGSLITVNFFVSSTISSIIYYFGFYLSGLQGYIWSSIFVALLGIVVLLRDKQHIAT